MYSPTLTATPVHSLVLLMVLLSALFNSQLSSAEVYKTVDKHGNIIYTDRPDNKEKTVELDLPPVNTQPATKVKVRPQTQEEEQQDLSYSLTLTHPLNGLVIPTGQRDLMVTANLNPELKPGHRLQLLLNGQPHGEPSDDSNILIKEIFRGEHKIQMAVVGSAGEVLSKSNIAVVSVIRASRLRPGT